MKKNNHSPYATNKGGRIEAPNKVNANEPKSTKTSGNDLRTKRG